MRRALTLLPSFRMWHATHGLVSTGEVHGSIYRRGFSRHVQSGPALARLVTLGKVFSTEHKDLWPHVTSHLWTRDLF